MLRVIEQVLTESQVDCESVFRLGDIPISDGVSFPSANEATASGVVVIGERVAQCFWSVSGYNARSRLRPRSKTIRVVFCLPD